MKLAPPSSDHIFGTDELGRDLFTRMLYGGRTTLRVAVVATAIAMVVGVAWGFVAAFREGWLGELLMRIADMLMAVPVILIGLVVESVIFRTIEARTVRRWGMQR